MKKEISSIKICKEAF
ncbi:hypothetical protein CPC197_1797B, partial [Chlamydia psittaci C1/97]